MITRKEYPDRAADFMTAARYISDTVPAEKLLFFDIETTGLSARTSYLYLIGCMYIEDGCVVLEQFFSEGLNEEDLLIDAFYRLMKRFSMLVHFNGQTFDIPYISQKTPSRCPCSILECGSFDIYRALKPLKKLFGLASMKQKALERFAGLERTDMYDGGELISVYSRYLATRRLDTMRGLPRSDASDELLAVLLLHNYEDIEGMLDVAGLLAIPAFFAGCFKAGHPKESEGRLYVPITPDSAVVQTVLDRYTHRPGGLPLPVATSAGRIILASSDRGRGQLYLCLPIYEGELRHYYDNYKDYWYLPGQDCAVHRSVGDFLDPSLKKRATCSTCYTKHTGSFAPAGSTCSLPLFSFEKKDRIRFAPVSALVGAKDSALHECISGLLAEIL